jgi:hypothetical protein
LIASLIERLPKKDRRSLLEALEEMAKIPEDQVALYREQRPPEMPEEVFDALMELARLRRMNPPHLPLPPPASGPRPFPRRPAPEAPTDPNQLELPF